MTDSSSLEASDPFPPPNSAHPEQGRSHPEQGWWTHWRSWRDAFPGLLLFEAIRPATWLSLLLIGSVAYWGCIFASAALDQLAGVDQATAFGPRPHRMVTDGGVMEAFPLLGSMLAPPLRPDAEAVDLFLSPAYAAVDDNAQTLLGLPPRTSGRSVWWMLLHRVVHLLIWAIPAGMVMRYAILSVAGRPRTGIGATASLAAKRFIRLMAVALLPLLAIGLAALFFLLPGVVARASTPGLIIAEILNLVAVPLALAAGLLAFGSLFAVPLGWAAVMTETDGDTFDAISRGYEYAFRRPFHLIGFLLLAWLISRILLFFAAGISFSAVMLAHRFFAAAKGTEPSLEGMTVLHAYLMHLPSVFAALLFWALTAGIYLLMRRATNGQEVEEIGECLASSG